MEAKAKRTAFGCGLAVLLLLGTLIVLFIVFGFAIETGLVPDTAAKPHGKIPSRQLRELRKMGVTRDGETILFFYSAAFLDIRTDGNLFTDQRVISYHEADGALHINDASYAEIAEIEFEPNEAWMEDSIITVTRQDGTWLMLYVANESNGDELFYDKLRQEWEKHKSAEVIEEQTDDEPADVEHAETRPL